MNGRADGVAVLVLLAAAIGYAWPLLSRLTTAVPGSATDHDVATMVWNVGYVYRALTTGQDLLSTRDVLVPFGADLRLHTYGLLQGLLATPFAAWLGAPAAYNLMLLATLAANGIAAYALAVRQGAHRAAAVVAATCVLLATPVLDQVRVGRPTFASLWIVALALVALGSLVEAPRLWKGLVLGALLFAAALTDFQIVLFCSVWLATLGIARWRHWRLRHAWSLALAAVASLVPFGALFLPALVRAAAAGYPVPTPADTVEYSFRFWDYFDPQVLTHAFGFELGAAAIAALVLLRHLRAVAIWLVGSAICLVLALGPVLQPTDLPLPFALLGAWPPLAQFRTPYRMAIPAVLGLSVVLGLVLTLAFSRVRMWHTATVAAVLVAVRVAFALVHDPLVVQAYPRYSTYDRLALEPGQAALLEVPFGVRSGIERIGSGGEVLSYYQHIHKKPLLNGMIARVPSSVFETYRQHPALVVLSGEPPDPAPARDDLAADLAVVIDWAHIGYVVVHRSMLGANAAEVESLLEGHPRLARDLEEADLVLYRVVR